MRPCARLSLPPLRQLLGPRWGLTGPGYGFGAGRRGAFLGLASFLLSAGMSLGFQLELLEELGSALFPFLSTASLHRVRLFKKLW